VCTREGGCGSKTTGVLSHGFVHPILKVLLSSPLCLLPGMHVWLARFLYGSRAVVVVARR